MRNMCLTIICVLSFVPASANDWQENCKNLERLAEQVMTARQKGIPMSKVMDAIKKTTNETGEEKMGQLIESMVIAAYEQPRYNTESVKENAIGDFTNQFYLECAKAARRDANE